MSTNKREARQLKQGLNAIHKNGDIAIGNAFSSFKENLSGKDYKKWSDLMGRLITAETNGNTEASAAIKEDIERLMKGVKLTEL